MKIELQGRFKAGVESKLPVMKPEKRKSGMLVTASATAALALQSAIEAVLPMGGGSTSAARWTRGP